MDISVQFRATSGLIALWEDIYVVQGKPFIAARLKPGIQTALWGVGPLFLSMAEGFSKYNNFPVEQRRLLLSQALREKQGRLLVSFLKRWLYYTARGCNRIERTMAVINPRSSAAKLGRCPGLPARSASSNMDT